MAAEKFTLRHPDGGHPVSTNSPSAAVRLRAQGYRDVPKKAAKAAAEKPAAESKVSTPKSSS